MVHMHRPTADSVDRSGVDRSGTGRGGAGRTGFGRTRAGRDRSDWAPFDPAAADWLGAWTPVSRPVPRHDRWQRLFRGQESELRQLRRWLCVLLPDTSARDDLISVAVELGTNAIQHTASGDGGWFTVEVACLGPVIRVAVTDEGGPGVPCLTGDPLSSGDLALDGDLDSEIAVDCESDC